jgi:hypothetical protein
MQGSRPARAAHPLLGEEVMAVDDVVVDVNVRCWSIDITSGQKERMGKHE